MKQGLPGQVGEPGVSKIARDPQSGIWEVESQMGRTIQGHAGLGEAKVFGKKLGVRKRKKSLF